MACEGVARLLAKCVLCSEVMWRMDASVFSACVMLPSVLTSFEQLYKQTNYYGSQ